jgi:hypothetical protein
VQDPTEGDAKYRCAECNLQFGTPRDLSRHLNKTARHGGQPSPCAICHKPLTRPDSRARHERRCRERFGVTEEMWQGIERERQRGRRKSISVDGTDEANKLAGEGSGTACDATTATTNTGREHRCGGGGGGGAAAATGSSRSRTVSVSEVSDSELVAALASTKVASSAPGPGPASMATSRFMPHPSGSGESGSSWATRKRSTSLRAPHPHTVSVPSSAKDPPTASPINGRKRRESSPQARGAPATSTQWRTPNRLPNQHAHHQHHYHQVRDDSPPFDPPSSPMAMQDESDCESMAHTSTYWKQQPRWTALVKQEERLVEVPQDAEEDEVDELAEDEVDLPWHPPPVSPRPHNSQHPRTQEGMMTGPPPKKKLFGFELDGTGGGSISGWPSHKTQR